MGRQKHGEKVPLGHVNKERTIRAEQQHHARREGRPVRRPAGQHEAGCRGCHDHRRVVAVHYPQEPPFPTIEWQHRMRELDQPVYEYAAVHIGVPHGAGAGNAIAVSKQPGRRFGPAPAVHSVPRRPHAEPMRGGRRLTGYSYQRGRRWVRPTPRQLRRIEKKWRRAASLGMPWAFDHLAETHLTDGLR